LAILRKNAGIYARTARAIENEFRVTMSRQAVRIRAENHSEELDDIIQESIDIAEAGLQDLMESEDERVKLQAIMFVLKTKGANRGYSEKLEVETRQMPPIYFINSDEEKNQARIKKFEAKISKKWRTIDDEN